LRFTVAIDANKYTTNFVNAKLNLLKYFPQLWQAQHADNQRKRQSNYSCVTE